MTTAPAVAAVGSTLAELRSFVGGALAAAADDPERLLVVAVPAPRRPPETLLRAAGPGTAVLWDPPQGRAVAGLGAAVRLDLTGPGRFGELRRRAAALFARLDTVAHPDVAGVVEPRLYGGFAFAPGAADEPPWTDFGDGCFTLPRFLYVDDGARAALALTVAGDELRRPAVQLAWTEELLDLRSFLERSIDAPSEGGGPVAIARPPFALWAAQIEAIRAAIRAGSVEKVVAARRSEVELAEAADPVAILARLRRGLRASTRFAFGRPGGTFLGATPERLVSLRDRRIETEALAGSIGTGAEHADELLRSAKDLEEHRLVVDEIVRRLGPRCAELEVAPRPRIRELRDVLHLETPIVGRLATPLHVLDLVEELHPTPAVGGVPTAEAVRWIAANEPARRGWYAGPIGWFDASGDGDFAVALRGCVVNGRRAYLYAGAGIVEESDPALESTEAELKEQALLASLG